MHSLLGNVIKRSKDSLLKESLQSQLVACVNDVQLDHAHSGRFQNSSDAAEALCTVLEAIFMHGIKESFADKMVLAMGDPDTRPEPNFWPALLVFSHRELIDQIGRLNFISTDVGRCRSWLRIALNDGLLTSYLQSMLGQNSALNSFYKRSAYLRDSELLDMFITLISGIEAYSFSLACNSSLLNMWTNQPLFMAGIWSPAMKACPITSGTDIARSLMDEDSVAQAAEDSVSSVVSVASYYESSLGSGAFDEDEALKIILGNDKAKNQHHVESNNVDEEHGYIGISSSSASPGKTIVGIENVNNTATEITKDNLSTAVETTNNSRRGSCTENNPVEHKEPIVITEKEVNSQKSKLQSYHSLVQSYNQTATTASKPDLQDLLQKFPMPSKPSTHPVVLSTESDTETMETLDFEVVPDNFDPSNIPEFRLLLEQVNTLAREPGLDSQNYTCRQYNDCEQHVGLNFGPAKVCGLTGAYYCANCFGSDPANEYWVIPARVIHNWDFHRYSVSHKAAEFLSQIQLFPLFDISAINPKIYSAVDEMARLKELRERLTFLAAYLRTCRENAMESLQKQIWPRDYLYEKIHHYSLSDLIQASTGALETALHKAVELSRAHVVSCTFCSQKGFICEICNKSQVIFPFDLDTTYRCQDCSAVYHTECLHARQLCPKCLRIQQRDLAIQPL